MLCFGLPRRRFRRAVWSFNFARPRNPKGVAASYGESVIGAIREAAGENMADAVSLLNICLPELQTVLARQRRDYGPSEEFPAEFPVFHQAANIDDTPVNNLAMERQCGTVDYRLKKLQTLPAVSRSMVLARAKELREGKESEFRSFKLQVARKQEVELEWKERIKKFAEGAGERQLVAQAKERKRLDLLDLLKAGGGPFTDAEQVQAYLDRPGLVEKEKQQRMKKELQFARVSSTTLLSVDPLFQIQVTLPNNRRRDKTAKEFGDSLMAFLGKMAESAAMEYNLFRSSLRNFNPESDGNNVNNCVCCEIYRLWRNVCFSNSGAGFFMKKSVKARIGLNCTVNALPGGRLEFPTYAYYHPPLSRLYPDSKSLYRRKYNFVIFG